MNESGKIPLPKYRVIPPVYFVATAAVMVALHFLVPVARLVEPPVTYFGWVLFAAGFLTLIAVKRRFDRAGTTIKSFKGPSALATDGLFAFSRNPVYLGMMTGLVGIFIILGSLTPVIMIPVFFLIIRTIVIPFEEKMMEATFGDAYREYRARVRRWL